MHVTPQEEQLLNSLTQRINQTQLQEKDPDAESLLNQELANNPDAIYILAQTVLVQNIALEQAKAQVTQLQQQAQQARQQPAHATSFLGSLLGHHDPAPPPPPQPTYLPPQQGYTPPPPPPPGYDPQYTQPQYGATGPPSFMRGAMQTAAGVAAGALAFEGVEAVLHGLGGFGRTGYGFGGPGMGMGGLGMGGGFERPVEETVVNNYYDEPGAGHAEHGSFDGGHDPHMHESADRLPDQGAQLSDAGYNTNGDNQQGLDSGNLDDQVLDGNLTQDDGSGFDDTGSFDDGGGGSDDSGSGF